MAGLGKPSALAFPLGGSGIPKRPWVFNRAPGIDQSGVGLLRPFRFSVRDAESYIDLGAILVSAGYSKTHAEGEELFDKELARTVRGSLLSGTLSGVEPTIELVGSGVQITKTSNDPQRSVYYTSVDGGLGYKSAMVSAVMRVDAATMGSGLGAAAPGGPLFPTTVPGSRVPYFVGGAPVSGAVLGLHHGPRNTAALLLFHNAGTPTIHLVGPLNESGICIPNTSYAYDYTTLNRYTIVWNEVSGVVEVYALSEAGVTTRLFNVAISSFNTFPSYDPRGFNRGDIVCVYGQEGVIGDQSTWRNVMVTTEVEFPFVGTIRPGSYVSIMEGSELIRTVGTKDPRDADLSPWFDTPVSLYPLPDPDSSSTVTSAGAFRMTKATSGKTFVLYREEPALYRSGTDGFMVQFKIAAENTLQENASLGSGVTIFDGVSVFKLSLFNDFALRTIGLLKKSGDVQDIEDHLIPETGIDWRTPVTVRFVADPRQGVFQLFLLPDLSNPILELPFDRSSIPSASDMGLSGILPFIAFGHHVTTATAGYLDVYNFDYAHLYQSWSSESAVQPTAADPAYTSTVVGSPVYSLPADGLFEIAGPAGSTAKLHRSALMAVGRGAIVEARFQVTSYRARSRTGAYVVLDDGIHAYMLTFVDSDAGKFVALSQRDGVGGFKEVVGRDRDIPKFCFPFDWTSLHTYRMERRSFKGLRVYVDEEVTPRLSLAETDMISMPDGQFSGSQKIAFGHFTDEGAISKWDFVRGFFGTGYEISTKRDKPDAVLLEELFGTRVVVNAYVVDADP